MTDVRYTVAAERRAYQYWRLSSVLLTKGIFSAGKSYGAEIDEMEYFASANRRVAAAHEESFSL